MNSILPAYQKRAKSDCGSSCVAVIKCGAGVACIAMNKWMVAARYKIYRLPAAPNVRTLVSDKLGKQRFLKKARKNFF